jgi:hypothetical protein
MLLFADSFDHYNTAQILRKYAGYFGDTIGAFGRNATNGVQGASTSQFNGIVEPVPQNPNTLFIGFAFFTSGLPNSIRGLCNFTDTGTGQVNIVLRPDGRIETYRGSTLLATTAVGIGVSQYNYFEVFATINNTTGAVQLRLNGTNILNLSGVNTRNTANNQINGVTINGHAGTTSLGLIGTGANMDDFYICDTTGSTNNTFLGDVRVQAIFPTGAGNYTQWSPTPAVPNWQNVDENPATDDTDYNASATAVQKDSFAFADITPATGTVYAVAHNLMMRKDDAGVRTVRALARLSGTDGFGANINVGNSYANYQTIFETKPGGGQYSIADVNNSEFGYDLVA